jgi:CheY-like chemotaxis protein
MERGGRIELRADLLRPAGPGGPGEVAVRVRDGGMGIAPEELSRIFDMFAQVQPGHRSARRGLGIGLTLVSNIVRPHGGRVHASSGGPGQGSEFVVYLPVPAVPAEATPVAPQAATMSGPQRNLYKILVVDDNRDSAESLAILLKLMAHETHMAFDGMEAIAAAKELRPDVVLLDIGMPTSTATTPAGACGRSPGRRTCC